MPSSEGVFTNDGLELQTGLPWSGYVYQPDFSSILLYVVVPLVEVEVIELAVAAITTVGAATSTAWDAEISVPSSPTAFTVI